VEYIRVGTYKKRLKEHPEKERLLWSHGPSSTFENQVATADLTADQALSLLDHAAFFEMAKQPLPDTETGLLDRLSRERLIAASGTSGHWQVTNLGAILFAKRLGDFEGLARKAVRVIFYRGKGRVETIKEQAGSRGYAAGFEELVEYLDDQLPRSEKISGVLRTEERTYPLLAVRELVANAIIHQDFSMTGVSPLVEIFADRVEITNPERRSSTPCGSSTNLRSQGTKCSPPSCAGSTSARNEAAASTRSSSKSSGPGCLPRISR
jgi:predicted HTH transcriptional regulator